MKNLRRTFSVSALLLTTLMVTSCATTSFKQAEVDLELHFYRWDSVCIAKPETRDNGFSILFAADEVSQQLNRMNIGRKLAAIVVGISYDEQQVRDIGRQWHERLAQQGFQRVVVLRGSDRWPIAKLPIVYDSAISFGHDTRDRSEQYAAAPTAARTDAAHSPGATIQ
jgi:hypothetical protein